MKAGLELSQDTTLSVEPIENTDDRELPHPGDQFGEYRIVRSLGRGGMGAVYEAEQLETGRRVALKVLTHRLNSAEARARFFREGRLAASINHPNSVYVYGTGEIEGTPAIVMELVDGGTLQDRVKRDGPLPVGKAVDAVIDVISGLQAAQEKGILHRDIKPSNCFEDSDGAVKVGDFGLSISSEAREEIDLTGEGIFLGTPAFCSPEQLRGEELNARSDLYSVGITLFYLLTGRTPFEGHTAVQLLANVLEKNPPSPKDIRPEIPDKLAKVVLRCLEKSPGERFRNYRELHRVLMPFATDAPVPGSLLHRFAAGFIDATVFGLISNAIFMLFAGEDLFMIQRVGTDDFLQNLGGMLLVGVLLGSLIMLGYYAFFEGRWGSSPGKMLCRLQIVDEHRNSPGFWKAGMRAVIFLIIPYMPFCIFYSLVAAGKVSFVNMPFNLAVNGFYYLFIALIFSTARKRNGLAGLHDLATRTRVIRKPGLETRPVFAPSEIQPVSESESLPRIGAYHVLEKLEQGKNDRWLLGYDARLLRKVWIHVVPAGTPEVPGHLKALRRIGRLRWISGRRSGEENWDVFEAPTGAPFLDLAAKPQSWEFVRFWLLDLAEELAASAKDGTVPETLSLDRVWINTEGRAKLLDFPAPRLNDLKTGVRPSDPGSFLNEVAVTALGGNLDRQPEDSFAVPIPLHARRFLEDKVVLSNPESAARELKPLTQKPARVTQSRRVALVAGCLVFPIISFFSSVLVLNMILNVALEQPRIMELDQLLSRRQVMKTDPMSDPVPPEDRLYAIYIAHHYGDIIQEPEIWNTLSAMFFIHESDRAFVEQSIQHHSAPTKAEIAEAEEAIGAIFTPGKIVRNIKKYDTWSTWLLVYLLLALANLLFYFALPAMMAALFFRGGLVLLAFGLAVVRKDGLPASRIRVFWRSLLTWAPLFILPAAAALLNPLAWPILTSVLAILLVGGLTVWSTLLPDRGIPDRLAGTRLVPR